MKLAIVSSVGRCGIREYSHMLMDGFFELGHRVHYIGVKRRDVRDLARGVRQVKPDDDLVIFEYEPGILGLWGTVLAMAWLRFARRKRILLSVHEIAPERYHEGRQIQWHLSRPVSRNRLTELLKLALCVGDVVLCFLRYRIGLLCFGWVPHVVLIHSPKGAENIGVALPAERTHYLPLVVKQLGGDRDAARREFGIPVEPFAFIIPGFLFRRKRMMEVIDQLASGTELWIVGTESPFDPGYLAEIEAYLAQYPYRDRVRLFHDYDRLLDYVVAADAGVFYYSEGYQSASASLVVGAGKPCIFSDLPAFRDLSDAGLTVRTVTELRQAMVEIQEPACYERLAQAALALREELSPVQIARRYLDWVGPASG